MSGSTIVGWCPGALRPMASGDGLILRVKPHGGRLTLDQAEAIARLSPRFGNGHLDLTGRANLQIRGARPETLEALTAGLREAGLLDPNETTEALRNIVVSPLAGLDPDGFDTRPFLADLEHCLATEPRLQALPAKWSFVVDGGGRLPLAGVTADMRFRFDREGRLQIGLDTVWTERYDGLLDLPNFLNRLAELVAAQPKPMRMRGLLAHLGPKIALAHLGLTPAARPMVEAAQPDLANLFSLSGQIVAFAPVFGDLSAVTLADIVLACRAAGGSDLRLTPWRVLLATGVVGREPLLTRLARMDLILDAADPRLTVSTCVGAPACHRATTPTRADAALLAARRGRDGDVHVAGCIKACARPAAAPWTLIARGGRYDLFRQADPVPCVTGLSSTEAANWLSRADYARHS